MEKIIRVPLFKDKIEPYQYKWLCSLFKEQTKEIVDKSEKQIQKIKAEREEKLKELNIAQDAIGEMFLKHYQVCLECRGEGTIRDYKDMYDDCGHSVKCKNCGGQGYILKAVE